MRVVKTIFKIIGTLILILTLSGLLMGFFFYKYITESVITSEKVNINLETMPVNLSSRLYYKDNQTGEYIEWFTLQNTENREWLDYSKIPDDFKNAFVAIEDERFWTHPGIDIKRTVAAGLNFATGKRVFGGSTITQQLVKNLSGDNEVTINRKITEICRAIKLEEKYSKSDILEWYLNIIYFGGGQYGIQAAANYYFNKDVKDLTLAEICSITGITNNPSLYSPYSYPENNQKRRRVILDKMLELEYITQTQHDNAYYEELTFAEHSQQQKSGAIIYPYYVDAVIEDVITYFQEATHVSKEQATQMLYYGGYNIYTCVDMQIQNIIDKTYQNPENIPKTKDNKQLQSSMVILDPVTGNIVGIAGGVGEKKVSRGLNWATSKLGRRPPGSSIKPIAVYGPAMNENLISPYSYLLDSGEVKLSRTDWLPQNDNRKYSGPITIHDAITRSVNTISAQVLDILTPEKSYDFMTQVLHMNLEDSDCDYAPLAVGQLSLGTTTREMASAYTIFPNMGVYKQGRTFSHITDADGNLKYENNPITNIAINENTAYWMTKILQDAVSYGTGSAAKLKSMPAAGKTGTTTNAKDRWFVGYTPYYIGAVWTGYETPSTMHASGNPAAKIWKQIMEEVHANLPVKEFQTPVNQEMPGPKLPQNDPEIDFDPANPDNMTQYPPELYPELYPEYNPGHNSNIIVIDPDNPETQENPEMQTPDWWQTIWGETPQEPEQEPIIITPVIPPEPEITVPQEPIISVPIEPEEPIIPITPPEVIPGQPIDPWTLLPAN